MLHTAPGRVPDLASPCDPPPRRRYQTALAVEPKCAEAHNNLGGWEGELGSPAGAGQGLAGGESVGVGVDEGGRMGGHSFW